MSGTPPRRGRRSGNTNSREEIVAAARKLFAAQGYDATSMRSVARLAGVDAALVHHYFPGKEALFAACVELPADPVVLLRDVVASPPGERGEAIVHRVLELWDSPARPALLILLRGALSSPMQASLLREALMRQVIGVAVADLPVPAQERRLRGSLVASQLLGLVVGRYVLKVEPLASAGHQEVSRLVGPTLQRYLTGQLDAAATAR